PANVRRHPASTARHTARESSTIFRVPASCELLLEFGDALLELVNALLERGELTEDHRGLPPFAVVDCGNAGREAVGLDRLQHGALRADLHARPDVQMT